MITDTGLNDFICDEVNEIDCIFFKEAVQEALRWGISDSDFEWFVDSYFKGKWWIFVNQN